MSNLNRIKINSIEDEYRIFWYEQLGKGANGYVYSCISKTNWQKYAMKIVPDIPKTRREVEMQMHCQDSPYTVSIIDVFCNTCLSGDKKQNKGDYLFIVMEYMRGGELFEIVRNYTDILSEAHWCIIIKKLILAVKDIHDMGVLHRDLKPENIFIREEFQINSNSNITDVIERMDLVIGDFGFATWDDSNPTDALFTPYYAAPEVLINHLGWRQNKQDKVLVPYDSRCDIWSLGVMIYALLSNIPPFYPETNDTTLTKRMYDNILNGIFTFDFDVWDTISYEARDLVSNLIQVHPDNRLTLEEAMEHPWFREMGIDMESQCYEEPKYETINEIHNLTQNAKLFRPPSMPLNYDDIGNYQNQSSKESDWSQDEQSSEEQINGEEIFKEKRKIYKIQLSFYLKQNWRHNQSKQSPIVE